VGAFRRSLLAAHLFVAVLAFGALAALPAQAVFPGQNGKIALVKELNDPASSHPEIYAVDPATGAQTNLTDNPAEDRDPAYSPDGRTIVFSSMRPAPCFDCNFEIYRMNSDGSGVVQLTDHPAFDDQPSFSPDGTRIVLLSGRNARSAFSS
jgi:TolB protein